MFIQTELTPNPNAMKFIPGINFNERGPIYYKSSSDCNSPLARELFLVEDVNAVFFGNDFITVSKNNESDWDIMSPKILMIMSEFFMASLPIYDEIKRGFDENISFSDLEKQIIEIIDTKVRPSVAMDGGDIIYKGFSEGTVLLELHGSCSGCPSSTITLKNGIENLLKHYIPEVISVEAVNSDK